MPKAIKLNMKQGKTYAVNHNDPEQLKKFDLDKQDDISSRLETLSSEQLGSSQEKGR